MYTMKSTMIYPAIPTRLHMLSHISLVDYEGVGRRFEVLVLVGGRGRRPVLLHSPTSPPLRHLVRVVPLALRSTLFHVRASMAGDVEGFVFVYISSF